MRVAHRKTSSAPKQNRWYNGKLMSVVVMSLVIALASTIMVNNAKRVPSTSTAPSTTQQVPVPKTHAEEPATVAPATPNAAAKLLSSTPLAKGVTQKCNTNYVIAGVVPVPVSYQCELWIQPQTTRDYNAWLGTYGSPSTVELSVVLASLCAFYAKWLAPFCAPLAFFLGAYVTHAFAVAAFEARCAVLKFVFADPAHDIPIWFNARVDGAPSRWIAYWKDGQERWYWGSPTPCQMGPPSPPGTTIA